MGRFDWRWRMPRRPPPAALPPQAGEGAVPRAWLSVSRRLAEGRRGGSTGGGACLGGPPPPALPPQAVGGSLLSIVAGGFVSAGGGATGWFDWLWRMPW